MRPPVLRHRSARLWSPAVRGDSSVFRRQSSVDSYSQQSQSLVARVASGNFPLTMGGNSLSEPKHSNWMPAKARSLNHNEVLPELGAG
jgi:hypothetical protein